MWALFKDGQQISKSHPFEKAAEIEAFEIGVIISGRFNPGKGRQNMLVDGYEIRQTENNNG